jgi:hypothetical protein
LGDDFNKLDLTSLDGPVRVFQGETFWLVQDFTIEPDPNRLLYDPTTNLIYFGYAVRWQEIMRPSEWVFCRRSVARDTSSLSRT